ncbi:MAG TPA: YicC family protein [Thiomicrospira sp.]|jgi:uncharacterized protein (TIGR00255 family)|nr:YicC family protein [Thiomicrospira sp.]
MSKLQTSKKSYSVSSMTAFARVQENTNLGRFSWEIRSVNQRYLEVNCRLPENYQYLEMAIREKVKQQVSRGKLDISLSIEKQQTKPSMQVNMAVLEPLTQAINQVQQTMIEATHVNPIEVLQWPGVLQNNTNQMNQEQIATELLTGLNKTLELLKQHRIREGQALAKMIDERCLLIQNLVNKLAPKLPELLKSHVKKMKQRIQLLSEQVDESRFHQEVAILAQKSDISEEIDRLTTHIKEVQFILHNTESSKNNTPIGRRLDFLMQELNREANTLGSKSIDTQVSQTSVELKVLIEQMREQVQNIE